MRQIINCPDIGKRVPGKEITRRKGAHRDFQTCGGSAAADDIEFELRHEFKIYARRGAQRHGGGRSELTKGSWADNCYADTR